jgi:hypothetical protein
VKLTDEASTAIRHDTAVSVCPPMPQYCNAAIPQYWNTAIPQHRNTAILQYRNTEIPQYSYRTVYKDKNFGSFHIHSSKSYM